MTHPTPSRAIALCGTEQRDVPGRTLRAGAMTVEFDNGQLRYLKINGVEVLRGIGFLVRDENWGTYAPKLGRLKIDQRADGFSLSFRAVCKRTDQEISYVAVIEATGGGDLSFVCTATPKTEFLTARTGFVVLHPLHGVAGFPVEIEHVDGKMVLGRFPELVDPVQPVLDIRALTHELLPGLKATVRMEGDAFEMEDHRNWTDASFKTYVRPLSRPWPYTLAAGKPVTQSITISLSGAVPAAQGAAASQRVEVTLGEVLASSLPPLGLGMPAEEIEHASRQVELLKLAAPRLLICQWDPRRNHGLKELAGYRRLCEQTGAAAVLEVVVASVDHYAGELQRLAQAVKESGIKLSAIEVCPIGDLKSVLPGGPRPPAPPLENLYLAARTAFPALERGGGMFSFFTELNRKRPPTQLLNFVHNTTCPIVHAADDRSVMETLEALPYQVATARSFIGTTGYRIGPSGIGCRDNPHGAAWTPNPDNVRICLTKLDPRQRGLFAAAWTLGYVATLARSGVERIVLGAPTGPLGIIYRRDGHRQPWYDNLSTRAVFPVFHVVSGLARGAGQKMVAVTSSDPQRVQCLAYRGARGITLWLANLSAKKQVVNVSGIRDATYAGFLDEASFVQASTDPRGFQATYQPVKGKSITLGSYAVAFLSIND